MFGDGYSPGSSLGYYLPVYGRGARFSRELMKRQMDSRGRNVTPPQEIRKPAMRALDREIREDVSADVIMFKPFD
jgi:hypothetical protein